tara:strand:- start:231 stop:1355 length:1125 start_codon:yes stop_codon:yes gene_type:complete
MSIEERLTILATPSNGDGVRIHVEKMVEQKSKEFDLVLKQLPHLEPAISELKSGNADLVAMSAWDWKKHSDEELIISAILPRREPTWVLVSDDKPEYLISKAKIVCDNSLIVRQLARLRDDLEITSSKDFISSFDNPELVEMDDRDTISWLEERRQEQLIDGFVTTRSFHSSLKFKSRRHTLGLHRDHPERTHFIPPPLHGFTLLVSRKGFPTSKILSMNDEAATICHQLESSLYESLDDYLLPIVGIYIEQRKIGTILREAKRSKDDAIIDSVIGKDGKPINSQIRIHMAIETLSSDGKVTAMCERIVPLEKGHMGMVNLLKEFNFLIEVMQKEHEELNRVIHGMPESYKDARGAILNLQNHSDSTPDELELS